MDTSVDALFVVNRVIDVLFALDMLLQFVLIVPQADGAVGISRSGYLTSPTAIAMRYIRSWFAIDLISVLVSVFDVVAVVDSGDSDSSDVSKLKALRVLRALRLIKLARLARASRLLKRWETSIDVNYKVLTLSLSGIGICFFAHLMGCIWALQARLADDPMKTWLSEYCSPVPTPAESGVEVTVDVTVEVTCQDTTMLYTAALYWAIMTITDSAEVIHRDNVRLAACSRACHRTSPFEHLFAARRRHARGALRQHSPTCWPPLGWLSARSPSLRVLHAALPLPSPSRSAPSCGSGVS